MSILFSDEELREQEEAVFAQYIMADSSARALKNDFPDAASRRALDAEILRAAALTIGMLRTNAHWIEQGLQMRMKENRR